MKKYILLINLINIVILALSIFTGYEIYLRQNIATPRPFETTKIEALEATHEQLATIVVELSNHNKWYAQISNENVYWLFITLAISITTIFILSLVSYLIMIRSCHRNDKK